MTALLPSFTAAGPDRRPSLPLARGPLTGSLFEHLLRTPHQIPDAPVPVPADAVADDDLQLALYTCYELHYRGFAGVDERWEWEPSLLAVRARLEDVFERAVSAVVQARPLTAAAADPDAPFADRLWATVAAADSEPSLSGYVAEEATLDQMREVAVHRSAYQLKEADPHTWVIPRLSGPPKAAVVEIQADEYGAGDPAAMHATLFADTMEALGLDPRYGAHLDRVPGVTLATVNLISLFGLHRRRRGALVGHLAVFEMTSVGPMSRYAAGLRRLGIGPAGRRFYEVHVTADAQHQVVAAEAMAAPLAEAEPELADDILFGARALLEVEGRFASHVLGAWARRGSSLRP
jgi:hypothetical protein